MMRSAVGYNSEVPLVCCQFDNEKRQMHESPAPVQAERCVVRAQFDFREEPSEKRGDESRRASFSPCGHRVAGSEGRFGDIRQRALAVSPSQKIVKNSISTAEFFHIVRSWSPSTA